MSVGFVVVSHSRALATAARDLAAQMTPGEPVAIEVAAGAGADGAELGTDAAAIHAALERVAGQCDGVMVLLDLGSAVMSTEMALEMLDDATRERVVVSPGPVVEGLVLGVIQASVGGDLAEVSDCCRDALTVKSAQLGG